MAKMRKTREREGYAMREVSGLRAGQMGRRRLIGSRIISEKAFYGR